MPGKAVGRAAVELPWLCPTTDSLIALADAPATVGGLSAADPALAAFLLRFARPGAGAGQSAFGPGSLLSAALPETALAFLTATRCGVLPPTSFALARVRAVTDHAARLAARLAGRTRTVPADAAATAARLAPLGWYAVAAVDPFAAADPLADPEFSERPAEVQARVWGLDHASVTRRLAARWRLPDWVATTVGALTLPFRAAARLASHRDLFAVVQLATAEAEAHVARLGLTHGADRTELLEHLHLDDGDLAALADPPGDGAPPRGGSGLDPNPHNVHLVPNLLRMAAESRRRNGPALVARLEEDVDRLHRVAVGLVDESGDRLREAKLDALAELAAGAAHEINNPLAVISGNAQRLLRTEPDPERGDALRAVVRQTERIAGILRDLMQFARPPGAEIRQFPLRELVQGVRHELAPLAAERGVALEVDEPGAGLLVEGDPRQLRHALAAVVRNGIEAASPGGWARLSCSIPENAPEVRLTVEDSGPGLSADVAEHAFDPFFCGRTAGRGRGLGLSTAWQLARQNGGSLRYEPAAGGATRFVLAVRRSAGHDILSLRSA